MALRERTDDNLKIFATDLDGTCIFSRRQLSTIDGFTEVDARGSYQGYMNTYLYKNLKRLDEQICFVPVTTRSRSQYERIRFSIVPHLALAANGAVLYVDGVEDVRWYELVQKELNDYRSELYKVLVLEHAKMIEDSFVVIKGESSEDVSYICKWCQDQLDLSKVMIHHKDRKVFVLPVILEKGKAVERLKARYGIEYVLGAGDSTMDTSLLEMCDKIVEIDQLKREGDYL